MDNININELIYYISNNVKAWNIILDCFKSFKTNQDYKEYVEIAVRCSDIARCIKNKQQILTPLNFPKRLVEDFVTLSNIIYPPDPIIFNPLTPKPKWIKDNTYLWALLQDKTLPPKARLKDLIQVGDVEDDDDDDDEDFGFMGNSI